MSYAFNVRAATASALATAIGGELGKVAEAQPIHSRDQEATIAAIDGLLALVEDPNADEELNASISGSCYGEEGQGLRGVSLNISIAPTAKPPAADRLD